MLMNNEIDPVLALILFGAPDWWAHLDVTANDLLTLGFVGMLTLCVVMELRRPFLRHSLRAVKQSYRTNLATFLFNEFTLSLLSIPSLYYIADTFSGLGLLSGMEQGPVKFLLTFILLDLTMYAWHYVMHHDDMAWVLHKVHHSDPNLNVTTGLRCHVGELALEVVVRAAFIMAMGVDAATFLVGQGIICLFTLLHHTNTRLPGEKWLSWIIITPRLHRVHHSVLRAEHDSNYGAVFSIWDRLFGTLQELEPTAIGLRGSGEQGFIELLRYGWFAGVGSAPAKAPALLPVRVKGARR